MSNWNNESEAREQIKALVAEYYNDFKKPEQDKEFTPGDRISYASRVYLISGSQQEDFQISLKKNLLIGSVLSMHI